MNHAKSKVQSCLDKAKKELQEGKKHRGLIKIEPNYTLSKNHLFKAERNLKVTLYLQKGGYTDWCSSSLFYTIYHCFLAILAKFGYETRNQECTFAVIADLINNKKIDLELSDLEKISFIGNMHESNSVLSIREEYQCGTKVSLENKEYEGLLYLTKKILDKTKEILVG